MILLIGKRQYVNTGLIIDIEDNEFQRSTMLKGWFQIRYINDNRIVIMYDMIDVVSNVLNESYLIAEQRIKANFLPDQLREAVEWALNKAREFILLKAAEPSSDYKFELNYLHPDISHKLIGW